jgi:hypothetical protein
VSIVLLIFILLERFLSKRLIIFSNSNNIEWILETPPKSHTYEEDLVLIK